MNFVKVLPRIDSSNENENLKTSKSRMYFQRDRLDIVILSNDLPTVKRYVLSVHTLENSEKISTTEEFFIKNGLKPTLTLIDIQPFRFKPKLNPNEKKR